MAGNPEPVASLGPTLYGGAAGSATVADRDGTLSG